MSRLAVALLSAAWLGASPAAAAALKDGTWLFGVGPGGGAVIGGAKSKAGMPVLVSGYALYAPRGEYSWGLTVDEALFAAKSGNKLRATALTFVGRTYIANKNQAVLPYALMGVGYSETHADLAGGATERGSGPALAIGAGFHRVADSAFNWAIEARFLRAAAPLHGLGISGPSLLAVTASLTWRTGPSTDPFGP